MGCVEGALFAGLLVLHKRSEVSEKEQPRTIPFGWLAHLKLSPHYFPFHLGYASSLLKPVVPVDCVSFNSVKANQMIGIKGLENLRSSTENGVLRVPDCRVDGWEE